jgi:hypothetical protein
VQQGGRPLRSETGGTPPAIPPDSRCSCRLRSLAEDGTS